MKKICLSVITLSLLLICFYSSAQEQNCSFKFNKHSIDSKHLNQSRALWVSLPMNYSDSIQYPVIYVLDAEWRFDLVRNIEFDLAGNKKIPQHIIVGIPHIDWEFRRGIDLTFSESRIEYDGEAVDSIWYNTTNSGGAQAFYQYLTEEAIPMIDQSYSTNKERILVGHSYGGYFAGYLLSMDHPFKSMQIYDPSIWYSNGEVIEKVKQGVPKKSKVHVYVGYQPVPDFHHKKIKDFVKLLKKQNALEVEASLFKEETHNSLYMWSFLEGILSCYEKD